MFENIREMKIEIRNEKYNQNQRNAIKIDCLNQIVQMLNENVNAENVRIGKVADGYAIEIANDEIGCICFTFDITMKNPNYDFDVEVELENEKRENKIAKANEKAKIKEAKIKEDKEKRLAKMEAKLSSLKENVNA